MSVSALSDLELNRTDKGGSLHLIAARLGLNAIWLETEKGDPESGTPYETQAPDTWPFQNIAAHQVADLDKIELSYAESALQSALADILQSRRKPRKA
jgi:hypothetical protein